MGHEKQKTLNPENISDQYRWLPRNTELRVVSDGVNPRTGVENQRLASQERPIETIEKDYLQNCDTLAGMFDDSIQKSEHFPDGEARHSGEPVTKAIYLDKSARPVSYLMRKIWPKLSDGERPESLFRNVDKGNWRALMSPETENVESPDVESISLDNFVLNGGTEEVLIDHLSRIRATFLEPKYLNQIDESNFVEEVWKYPTTLDDQRVAIIDEVKSSGATLKIADTLLRAAIPEARFEPMHWSSPGTVQWDIYDTVGNPTGKEFAAKTVPVWYDADTSEGRGIGELNPGVAQRNPSLVTRLGKYVLSNAPMSSDGDRAPMDKRSIEIKQDLDVLADRFLSGQVMSYIPSLDRDKQDLRSRIEKYFSMPLDEWRKTVRGRNE